MKRAGPRAASLLAALGAGGGLGAVLGQALGGAGGAGAAAAAGIAAAALLHAWHEARGLPPLLAWLRDPQGPPPAGPAPDAGDVWDEIGQRAARALRHAHDETLAEARRRLQFVGAIDASPNGVVILGADGEIRWFNATAASHLGLSPGRDAGQRITHLLRDPAAVAYLKQADRPSAATATAPDGRTHLLLQSRPAGDGMTLLITQDVTERERTDAMRRDFVANVSHEMRSPLTVLAGFVETLQTLPLSAPERDRVLALMAQQTARMQALLTDLLALAQIEGAPRPPLDRWVPVQQLLAQMQADARALDQERHALTVEPGPPCELGGNETELLSAAWNLLANSLRHTPAGCRIGLAWRLRPDGRGELEVADDGPGIAREHLPRLTERFYRVDPSRSRETGGTGLGLAIVKHVVQRHGGELEIDSAPGRGARFRLLLPAHRVRVLAAAPAAA